MDKGFLIAFEGIDGTGKSTQIQLLNDFLQQKGCSTVVTREPTDGSFGQKIRRLYLDRAGSTPQEELALFIQDRKEHVRDVLIPHLENGQVVLTDRYYFSTAAYQGAAGLDIEEIFSQNNFAPEPDLVILLTMDPEVSKGRIQEGRGEELNDFEQLDQLKRVAINFGSFEHSCISRIGADRPIEQVEQDIRKTVRQSFAEKGYICRC